MENSGGRGGMKKTQLKVIISNDTYIIIDDQNIQPVIKRKTSEGKPAWSRQDKFFSSVDSAVRYLTSKFLRDVHNEMLLDKYLYEHNKYAGQLTKKLEKDFKEIKSQLKKDNEDK